MKSIWSEQAIFAWQRIADYIWDNFGDQALLKFQKETIKKETEILEFPNAGQKELSAVHATIVYRYVVINHLSKMIYHVDGDIIYIDVFWDTRLDPKKLVRLLNNIER